MDLEVVSELKSLHKAREKIIRERLREFRETGKDSDERILAELCFCICTPQSKAKSAWYNAIQPLMTSMRLYAVSELELMSCLRKAGVRFHRKKAGYIVLARKQFSQGGVREKIGEYKNIFEFRDYLVENVKGLGMKEASHFLRNIGLGQDLTILDRHILKNLVKLGIIDKLPGNLTRGKYLEIEDKMRRLSGEIGIPLDELDLLLWFKETGEVFK